MVLIGRDAHTETRFSLGEWIIVRRDTPEREMILTLKMLVIRRNGSLLGKQCSYIQRYSLSDLR